MSERGAYRELTVASVLGGVLTGLVLNVGIVFAGLQIGFTIVGSTVGAIVGFGLLRGMLGKRSILEVNVFQTVASSVNMPNSGIIFTVPVLFLLGLQERIDYTALLLASLAGSLLGIVLILPLRKQIVELERLRFPTAVGVAQILKSPGAGREKARLLFWSVALSAVVTALRYDWKVFEPVLPASVDPGPALGLPAAVRTTCAVSLLSIGSGYLAGRAGLAILYGTLLNYWFLVPVCLALGWVPAAFVGQDFWGSDAVTRGAFEDFLGAFSHFTSRNIGIGLILGGAVAGLFVAGPAVRAALASLRARPVGGRREELPLQVLSVGTVAGLVLLFVAAKLAGGDDVGWGSALVVTVAGALWMALASLVVAQTTGRTDWSPLSGLALIAIAILMGILGTEERFIVPAVTIGAAVCVATSMCADMMADLKTGYLIGGLPVKQQIAQLATCWIGPGVAVFAVVLLWNAYRFGPDQAERLYAAKQAEGPAVVAAYEARGGSPTRLADGVPVLGAPQAGALEGALSIVQSGDVPLGKYLAGAALGLTLSFVASPGIGVMVGLSMYLPFQYMIVFGLGGVANVLIARRRGERFAEEKGVPIAAGLIVGDALVGVANAMVEVLPQLLSL